MFNRTNVIIKFFASLLLLSTASYADNFELVRDLNQGVIGSDSTNMSQTNRSVYDAATNKVVFVALNILDNGIHDNKLWVTDGSKEKTVELPFLPEGRAIYDFEAVNGQLIVLADSGDSLTNTELWSIDLNTMQATLLHDLPCCEYPRFSYNTNTILKYGNDKLLFISKSSEIYVFSPSSNSLTMIELLDNLYLEEKMFIKGDELFYNINLTNPQREIQLVKTNLINGEHLDMTAKVRISSRIKIEFDNEMYFFSANDEGSGKSDLWVTDGTIAGTKKLVNSVYHAGQERLKVLGDTLVIPTIDGFFIKKAGGAEHTLYVPPIYMRLASNKKSIFISQFNDSFYLLATSDEAPLLSLYKTNFIDEFDKLLQSDKDAAFLENWSNVQDFYSDNGKLYIYTAETRRWDDYRETFENPSKIFSWDESMGQMRLLFDGSNTENFNIISRIHQERKDIIFAHTRTIGVEPWVISSDGSQRVNLADINTSAKTMDTKFFYDRMTSFFGNDIVDFSQLVINAVTTYYSSKFIIDENEIIDIGLELETPEDRYLGYDSKNNYFVHEVFIINRSTVQTVTIRTQSKDGSSESSVEHRMHCYSTFREDSYFCGVNSFRFPFFRGDFTYLGTPVTVAGIQGNSLLKFFSNDLPNSEVYLNSVYFDAKKFEHGFVLYNISGDENTYKLTFVKDNQISGEFSIDKNLHSAFDEPIVNGNYVFIKSNEGFHYFKSGFDQLKLINLSEQGILNAEIIYTSNNMALISANKDNAWRSVFRINLESKLIEQVTSLRFTHVTKNGKYFVAITNDSQILTLDSDFNIIKSVDYFSQLGYDISGDEIQHLSCHKGYCFIMFGMYSSDRRMLKFDLQSDTPSDYEIDVYVYKTLWRSKNKIYFDGNSELYGRELFSIEITEKDTDGDGIPDAIEQAYDLDMHNPADALEDQDGDGLSNGDEFIHDTSIINSDTDFDGINDKQEIDMGFNPKEYDLHLQDRDQDGSSYRRELKDGTNPLVADSDGDGYIDSEDIFPTDVSEYLDTDMDGIGNNADEDDDNDGMPDTWEIQYGLDPLDSNDAEEDLDNDTFSNIYEYTHNTDPTSPEPQVQQPQENYEKSGGAINFFVLMLLVSIRKLYLTKK